jgi:hypothetical protein
MNWITTLVSHEQFYFGLGGDGVGILDNIDLWKSIELNDSDEVSQDDFHVANCNDPICLDEYPRLPKPADLGMRGEGPERRMRAP